MRQFIFLLFLLTSLGCFAQIETPKRKLNILPKFSTNPKIQIDKPQTKNDAIQLESKFFKNNDEILKNIINVPKVGELPNQPKEAPRPAAELFQKNYLKSDGTIQERFKSDTFLGEFKTGSKTIRIGCRDHEYPDGDMVRIWVNDKVIVNQITLQTEFQELFFELNEGFNKIEFEALNQGESGPNTAQFVMFDNNKKLITSNIWNLTTGVKAKVIIVKEENTLVKKYE